jgi:flagellar protein FliO/FliZ
MKAVLMKLVILTLLLPCAFGQAIPPSDRAESESINGDSGIAANPVNVTPMTDVQEEGASFPLLRTFGGTGLVLCLIIGIYFAARKFAPRYFSKEAAERNMKVIETLPMGDRRSLSLVEVGGNRLLVGITPQQINLLVSLPEGSSSVSEPDTLVKNLQEKIRRESASPFRNLFDVEKKERPQYMANALPEDIRMKMRQLRKSLER